MGDTVIWPMSRILACLALFSFAQPALAGLTVCNKTAHPAKLALGRFDGTRWTSQGWWRIAGHRCATVISNPLDARYYYLYASDGGPGSWDGGHGFCTAATDTFKIAGRGDCAGRGYDRKDFFEVDTGDRPDFTQSLSD